MKNKVFSNFRYLAILILSLTLHGGMIYSAVSAESSTIRLVDHVPTHAVKNSTYLKRLERNTKVPLTFMLPLRNQEELQELIVRLHNPSDEMYGKYLTADEFVERFAPSQEDYDQVVAYANNLGLTIHDKHPNRLLLNVSGKARSIESSFNLNLHKYALPNGRQFYAPNMNPEVSSSVASVISGIAGLDNHAEWHPFHRQSQAIRVSSEASHTYPSGPGGGFSPSDIVKAYNLSGIPTNGSNQIIALFELADYQASDINAYTSYFGLPSAKLNKILVNGGSGSGIDAEVTLDIELALALAPESEIYVYEGPNSNQGVLNTYNRIATDNLAKQVSTSWGLGENLVNSQYLQAENAIFQQMAAQGQTIYAAAGDSGAYDDYSYNDSKALIVDDPASQPYVVGVGGTSLSVNASTGVYETETVWNDGVGNGAGGGGVSSVWTIPSWQSNVSTTYSKTYRNVPDVALNANQNTGYAIYYDGQWQIFGGTSCAAPLWAAFTACVNQSLVAAQKPVVGFANPKIYSIGEGASYTTDFHDITTGNNLHYNAEVGYDNASGWGSFNGINLYSNLTGSIAPPSPPSPPPTPSLFNLSFTHNAPFIRGEIGTYKIIVSNAGQVATSGPVAVAVTLPNGLSYSSYIGSGWQFNSKTLTFTQINILEPASSYPTITLNVRVSKLAPYSVTPSATVSGGGLISSKATNLTTTY